MRAFVVIGPESTGTRVLTQILISAGCVGDGGHEQRFDSHVPLPSEVKSDIVWRRSVPHFESEKMPFVDKMKENLKGYNTKFLVTSRSMYPAAMSQMRHRGGLDTLQQAYQRINRAYSHIFDQVAEREFTLVTYEGLEMNSEKICDYLNIGNPKVKIYNGNSKYFD